MQKGLGTLVAVLVTLVAIAGSARAHTGTPVRLLPGAPDAGGLAEPGSVDASSWAGRREAVSDVLAPGSDGPGLVMIARAAPGVCGDGIVEGSEQCDDGNTAGGDCCSPTCTFEDAGSPCSDGDGCTVGDACDGAGSCVPGPPLACVCGNGVVEGPEQCDDGNTAGGDCCSPTCTFEGAGSPCSDGDGCTVGDACDGAGSCLAGSPFSCDDGVPCTVDACVSPAGTCVHTPTPLTGCRSAGRSRLFMSSRIPTGRNKLNWAWTRGAATTLSEFADPRTSAEYFLCIFADGSLATAAPIMVPASASRWKSSPGGRGFRYWDGFGTESGVLGVVLRPGPDGRARARLRARGFSLPVPQLPLALPVRAQLVNGATGMCWESVFDRYVQRSTQNAFRAVQR